MSGNIQEFNSSGKPETPRNSGLMDQNANKPLDLSGVAETMSNGLSAGISVMQKKKNVDDSMWALSTISGIRQDAMTNFVQAKEKFGNNPEGFTKNYMAWYDQYTNKALDSAPSEEAKNVLKRNIIEQKDGLFADALQFETASTVQKRKETFANSIEASKLTLLHNPSKWKEVYNSTFTNNPLWDNLSGQEKETLKQETKSSLAIATLTGQLNNADAIPDLNKRLSAYEGILKGVDSGAWDTYLQFDTQAKTSGSVTNQIERLKNEIDSRNKEAVSSEWQILKSQLDDHQASLIQTGVGVVSRDKVAFIAGKLKQPELLVDYDNMTKNARGLHTVMSSIDLDNPNAAAAKIESLKPQPGDEHYETKFQAYSAAKSYYDTNLKAVVQDPAAYGAGKASVQAAYHRSEQEGIKASLGVQAKFGLPEYARKVLSKTQAVDMVKQINSLPPDKVEGFLDGLHKKYNFNVGDGTTAYDKIFAELHSLPEANRLSGNYSVLASVTGTPVANDLIKAIKQGPELKAALPAGVSYTNILGAVKGNLTGFSKALGPKYQSSSDLSNIYSATTNLAMQYLNSGKAANYVDAAKMASKNLVLNNYDIKQSPKNQRFNFYIPKEIDGSKIDTNKVYEFLNQKQNHKDINNFIGSNYFGEVLKTEAKPHETKQLTYYADHYISSLNKKLGTNYIVTSRYRADNRDYHSMHSEGKAVDISLPNYSKNPDAVYKLYENELRNPLVKSIGTSDPTIINAFKGNPKIKDLRGFDGKHGTSHKTHAHITLDTSAGDLVFGSYSNNPDEFSRTMKHVVNTGFWTTNSSGTGAYLMYENPKTGNYSTVYNSKGKRYEFSFKNVTKGT